jgi:hypothetical protein
VDAGGDSVHVVVLDSVRTLERTRDMFPVLAPRRFPVIYLALLRRSLYGSPSVPSLPSPAPNRRRCRRSSRRSAGLAARRRSCGLQNTNGNAFQAGRLALVQRLQCCISDEIAEYQLQADAGRRKIVAGCG